MVRAPLKPVCSSRQQNRSPIRLNRLPLFMDIHEPRLTQDCRKRGYPKYIILALSDESNNFEFQYFQIPFYIFIFYLLHRYVYYTLKSKLYSLHSNLSLMCYIETLLIYLPEYCFSCSSFDLNYHLKN